jgi:Rod binding domain-containing protein
MNISSIQTSNDLAGQDLQRLAQDPSVSDGDKVAEVARQFESYLLRQYLGEARKTLVESRFNPDAGNQKIYHDMITSELADNLSKSGAIGLATALKGQLSHEAGTLQGRQNAVQSGGSVEMKRHE